MSRQLNLSLSYEDKKKVSELRKLIENKSSSDDPVSYIAAVRDAVSIALDYYKGNVIKSIKA